MDQHSVNALWKAFKKEHPEAPEHYEVWAFGDSKEIADELAGLVLEGIKTATASNYILYELEKDHLPEVGLHNVILDGADMAVAIVVTESVEIVPFNEVTAEHAYLEGEGDRSLEYWRDVHETFFKRELETVDRVFHEEILIVCERLKLIYK